MKNFILRNPVGGVWWKPGIKSVYKVHKFIKSVTYAGVKKCLQGGHIKKRVPEDSFFI